MVWRAGEISALLGTRLRAALLPPWFKRVPHRPVVGAECRYTFCKSLNTWACRQFFRWVVACTAVPFAAFAETPVQSTHPGGDRTILRNYAEYAALLALIIFAVWNRAHKKLLREARYAQRLEQDVRDRTAELAQRNEELESVNRRLLAASVTDPLTGLGNRRYLLEAVAALTRPVAGPSDGAAQVNSTIALLIVDLDHLKPVNDVYGHQAGDQILLQVAEILRHCCRASDYIARWGGDEFVIAYRDEDLDAAEILAERIRARVAKRLFRFADGKVARTSCSIGFSRYPFVHQAPELFTWEQCLAIADAALYHAKKQRNGWIGWAGTAACVDVPAFIKLLQRNPEALERDGSLEVRRPVFRPEDTVDNLRPRNRRRGD